MAMRAVVIPSLVTPLESFASALLPFSRGACHGAALTEGTGGSAAHPQFKKSCP